MNETFSLSQIDEVADAIRARTSTRPQVGIILGSGLGEIAAAVEKPDIIPYHEIPNWPVSTVHGHAGRLVTGILEMFYYIPVPERAGISVQTITVISAVERQGVSSARP